MNEIVIRDKLGAPSEHEMMVFQTMSKAAVDSKMYKGVGDQAGLMMIMLSARELGIPPCQALNGGINIIQGKVEISARMMSALIRKAGHKIITEELNDNQCILKGVRCDTGETQRSSFSIAEAQKAGIFKAGGGWTKWPKDMCFARALSRLSRQLFSDVIGIGYVEGEIKAAECEVMPEPVPTSEVTLDEEMEWTDKYLELFDKVDKYFAMEYLKIVMAHFGWNVTKAIQELMKDKNKLFEKFNTWKNKQETKPKEEE